MSPYLTHRCGDDVNLGESGIRTNDSRGMVSVPLHQVMRSTCPVFTVLITRFRYGRLYSTETYISLIPVTLGVGLATYGDYYFSSTGFFLTFLGVMLASAKVRLLDRLSALGFGH